VAMRYDTVDALDGDGDFPINMSGAGKVGTAVLLGTPNLFAAEHAPWSQGWILPD
jgi:hypothetical protein